MFLEYYKLHEQPFGVTPDPRFLYFGPTHREAFASLLYAIDSRRGFAALVAEPGMGKTSLLFGLLQYLGGSARTAFLFQPHASQDLLASLLRDLGIHVATQDPLSMHEALNTVLLEEMRFGRHVVVVIDEAQNLDDEALEFVRLLSNFETPTQKLMHIVLAGQPGLAEKLAAPQLAQLRQRVSTIIRLERFSPQQTVEYIEHRLRATGHQGAPLFSQEALTLIARVSQGIPRNINSLCFLALSLGFATQRPTIDADMVCEVAAEFDFTEKRAAQPDWTSYVPRSSELAESAVSVDSSFRYAHRHVPKRFSVGKTLAAVGTCLAIPLLSIVALSDANLGLGRTMAGRICDTAVNSVLASIDPTSDFAPKWPDRLKPWPASSLVTTTEGSAPRFDRPTSSSGPENEVSDRADVRGIPGFKAEIDAAERLGPDGARPAFANSVSAATPSSEIARTRRGKHARTVTQAEASPSWVQVQRPETLFEFTLEHYGKSNRSLIATICGANSQIRGPYDVLSPGQWLRLPKIRTKGKRRTDAPEG